MSKASFTVFPTSPPSVRVHLVLQVWGGSASPESPDRQKNFGTPDWSWIFQGPKLRCGGARVQMQGLPFQKMTSLGTL
ncbi:hypothetical protein ISF9_056 [Microbacterium phage vB_MoxS-ISF9]|uniref:Uncharacterized protein n=1 Tax=Microbacterium phage vB_MoxS-ISF9 TaxID=1458670 RepID=W8PF87_9CAUD|nr:hypothetical protein ISF9_056 [Microbacterium phage vB_MoxS-ISF9]AHL18526.1 hypothetical protein ISF9_056 [Microbacterium phage vB_MoxS-ISF9]